MDPVNIYRLHKHRDRILKQNRELLILGKRIEYQNNCFYIAGLNEAKRILCR